MTLQTFENNLKAVFPDVYHPRAPKGKTRYVIWNTYGRSSIQADDRNQVNCPKVQIDICTQQEEDPMIDDVLAALWMMDLPYTVVGEGYDQEYNAFRTTLTLVVV